MEIAHWGACDGQALRLGCDIAVFQRDRADMFRCPLMPGFLWAIARVGELPPRSFQAAIATPARSGELPMIIRTSVPRPITMFAPTVLQAGHAACVFIKRVEQPTDN
jgi:hypothetical protein